MHARTITRLMIVLVVLALLSLPARGQAVPPALIEPVVRIGDPAPGMPGFTVSSLYTPQIDGAGNVYFMAVLEGAGLRGGYGVAVLYGSPGGLQLLMRDGDPAPDMPPGVVIEYPVGFSLSVAENGWIALKALVAGAGIVPDFNDEVLYVGPPDDLRKVLQAGDPAPGCEPGASIEQGTFFGRLSDNATLLVSTELAGPGVPEDRVYWIGTRDNLELVYRDGMQAPGCDEGVVFRGESYLVHNDAGQVAFRGSLQGPGVSSANDSGRWLGGPGTLAKIVRRGDPVPSMGEGVTWKSVAGGRTITNGFGEVLESGSIQGPGVTEADDSVLFMGNNDGLELVGREGDPAPEAGDGVYFELFSGGWINNQAEAFYRVRYAGMGITEANRDAMYFGPRGAARLTLRDGDPAPTFPPEITLWRVVAVVGLTAMNDVGEIIAPTQIAGPGVTEDDKVVLWLRHGVLGRWVPLLRSGMSIDGHAVFAEDEYDFGYGYYSDTGGSDGRPQSMNDLGVLAIELEFTDGTAGIYRISPPPFGDGDGDADVDLADWSLMHGCLRGPDGGIPPDCDAFDLDWDGDVDVGDYALFQQLFQGSQ
jgi:hypothetical protein